MTKHIGFDNGDFHIEESKRRRSIVDTVLPRLFDFLMPLVLGLLAFYIGRYGFG